MRPKDRERLLIQRAVRLRPDLFIGDLDLEDRESPDFMLRDGESLTGIELTRFTSPRPEGEPVPDEQHSLRLKALKLARERCLKGHAPPMSVQAIFKRSPPLAFPRVPSLAEEITEILDSALRDQPVWTRYRVPPQDKRGRLKELGLLAVEPPRLGRRLGFVSAQAATGVA